MRDDDDVEVIPRDILVGKISEHGGDERGCSVVHVQPRLSLRESDWFVRRLVRWLVRPSRGEGTTSGVGG